MVGHLELARQLERFGAAIVHENGLFVVQFLILPNTCEASEIKCFHKPPESAEFLEFVIIRRSANHSLRPGSKAAPKKSVESDFIQRMSHIIKTISRCYCRIHETRDDL